MDGMNRMGGKDGPEVFDLDSFHLLLGPIAGAPIRIKYHCFCSREIFGKTGRDRPYDMTDRTDIVVTGNPDQNIGCPNFFQLTL
jgi:hypothetical protein